MEIGMSLVESGVNWFRQTFAWSNSWTTWRERLVLLLFVVLGILLFYLSAAQFAFWQSCIVWSVYAVVLAVCSRQGWIKLFGPVLFYDMVRTSRRSRYSIIRILYGGFLFLVLSYMLMMLMLTPRFGGGELRPRDTAVLTETFFGTFMLMQLVMVVLLTPAYVAGAIAEEKDRKTLEFLMATDLRNREIVLSKFISRLANLALLLLTGLPILSILQLIGGVDPELMLAGFAGIGLTMLGIASISILLSTLFKKPRDAISLTYLFLLTYASVTTVGVVLSRHPVFQIPIWFGDDPPTLSSIVMVLNAGNPIMAVYDVMQAIGGGFRGAGRTNLAAELPGILTRYAWFHFVLSAICITWSIARVRAIALKQTSAGTTVSLHWWERVRPAVGDFPMFWKEFFIDGRTKFNWLVWLAVLVLVLLTLGSGVWVLGDFIWNENFRMGRFRGRGPFEQLSENMNIWFRFAGTSVACLTLLMIAVRASTSITSERERDTFDALIATPLSGEGILLAKVMGNMMSMRPAWLWFGSMLLLALCTGGIHPLAVPIIISAWLVYALFVTMIGLTFSMFCKSSIWSALFTVLTTLVLGGGHWLITSCCCAPIFSMLMMAGGQRGPDRIFLNVGEYFVKFQAGLTPPFVFAWCSFPLSDHHHMAQQREFWELLGMSLVGLFLWTVACAILWFGILVPKFKLLARRNELEYS
jgi:ABC-type transport system involved in multi-copper enzyme maturation permease subunit